MRLFFLLIFASHFGFSQNFDFSGGALLNHYFDNKDQGGNFASKYEKGLGFKVDAGYETKKMGVSSIMLRVGLEHFGGGVFQEDSDQGGFSSYTFEGNKTVANLSIYPINFLLKDKIDLSLGFKFDFLLHESFEGDYKAGLSMQPAGEDRVLEKVSSSTSGAIAFNFGYRIQLSNNWILVPTYNMNYGVLIEFNESHSSVKSLRNFFGVSIKKDLSQ